MTFSIEIKVGKESAAIQTLLARQIYFIRSNKLSEWYEYADTVEKFSQKVEAKVSEVTMEQIKKTMEPRKKL